MSKVLLYLRKSLHCKPQSSDVYDPKTNKHHKRKNISNHSNKQLSSPKPQARNVMLNHVTHEIVFDSKSGEIKICPCYRGSKSIEDGKCVDRSTNRTMVSIKTHRVDCDECCVFSKPKVTMLKDSNVDFPAITFPLDTIEEQDICEHSVTNLHRQDSSWQIIKKVCNASNVNGEIKSTLQIESVLKVQNMQEAFACFEEFREMVKVNAASLQIKHPRCLVDGNEMLRFHGTIVACSLGISESSSLCTLDQCGLCQILRLGFTANQKLHDNVGVFTTSTCSKAIDSIRYSKKSFMRKCVIVCRVIAGRINNPLQEIQEMGDLGYDSLVKKISCQLDIEELIVLNPRGVLPCFVVLYKL